MADNTKIEWADATLNYANGCSVLSPGCTNCYAMKLAGTRLKHHPSRGGLTTDSKAGPVWTGEVRLNDAALQQALKWRKPRKIFWNAHGDLFHEGVPDEAIDRLFAVCALTPQHTHMILTKRSARMRDYFNRTWCDEDGFYMTRTQAVLGRACSLAHEQKIKQTRDADWPLPNVWLGVSVEDQTRADQRIPDLLATPAAVRFISAEPLLGRIDLRMLRYDDITNIDALTGDHGFEWPLLGHGPKLDWVIVGGESGQHARPMHPNWARSLRDQCAAASVPFFFKQWGLRFPVGQTRADGTLQEETVQGGFANLHKNYAGRLLDGIEHNAFPSI